MATMNAPKANLSVRAAQIHADTPFYSRNYGGFSKDQWAFFRNNSGPLKGKKVLDPMAGQAFYLSQLAWEGCDVTVGDINPAPLLLASLRAPEIVRQAEVLKRKITKSLSAMKAAKRAYAGAFTYCDDWLAPATKEDISRYATLWDLTHLSLTSKSLFWESPAEVRFAAALPVLAARDLTCFRSSGNFTWLKQGGLQRDQTFYGAVVRALDRWGEYAQKQSDASNSANLIGSLSAAWMDAERTALPVPPNSDIVVTSPAYANRLDYTSLWAPELAIVTEIFGIDSTLIKANQIGTTVVRGKTWPPKDFELLPPLIKNALTEIQHDADNIASESYYYPFFVNYAVAMMHMLENIERAVRKGGKMFFFVRDTVRKDTIFPTGKLIENVLRRLGWRRFVIEKKLVRHHIGMKRRSARSGIYGLAQTEWWLGFERKRA